MYFINASIVYLINEVYCECTVILLQLFSVMYILKFRYMFISHILSDLLMNNYYDS